jgi:MoaA/NifB/PqqE/SkfB family radical SAM enzyme
MARRYPAAMRYEFPNVRWLNSPKMDVEFLDGRLVVKAEGPFAALVRRLFTMFFDVYNDVGPVGTSNGAGVYTLYVPPIPSPMHMRHTENFVRRWLYRTRIPLAVTLAVTDKCQLKCGHCSAANHTRPTSPLSLDELQRVIRESVDLGVTNVTFTGGEPLLRDDLEETISAVPQDKAVSLVFTNGLGLTPERARQLKSAGLWGVQVSLDSPDPQEHDAMRGWTGCFEAVKTGIRTAKEAGLLVGLSTYATNAFVEEARLGKMASLGAAWGVHELTVFDAIPSGRLQEHEEVLLTPGNRARLLEEARELHRVYRARMHVITQSWTNSRSGFARFIGCLAGHYQFHISAGGDFRPCDFTPLSIGNIRQDSVSALWKKITSHPAYRRHSQECRMQNPSFREEHIHPIPADPEP